MKQPNKWAGWTAEKTAYTLNGYMFSLVGIYDWSKTTPDATNAALATGAFDCGISTLERIWPYYEIGGWTSYDLRQIYGAKPLTNYYALVHSYLIRALRQVTKSPELRVAELRILKDMEGLNYKLPVPYEYVPNE